MIRTKTILSKIAEPNLSLYKGQGYFYFVYDDGDKVYKERCVMLKRIRDQHGTVGSRNGNGPTM